MKLLLAFALAVPSWSAPAVPPQKGGTAAFFFHDHESHQSYVRELKAFVARQDAVILESVTPRQAAVLNRVSRLQLTPAEASPLFDGSAEPMNPAFVEALYGSGVRALPEPIFLPAHRELNRRKRESLRRAVAASGRAAAAFADDGDVDGALEALGAYYRHLSALHARRDEALVEDVKSRLRRPRALGVVFGDSHVWPVLRLRNSRAVSVARPPSPLLAYMRPLQARRLDARLPDREEERDQLSYLLFHELLDPRFRSRHWADRKIALYNAIADRLRVGDLYRLAQALSEVERPDERRLSKAALNWLAEKGFLKPEERRFFRWS